MPEETPQLELLPSGPKGDIPSTYTGECRALNQPAVLPPPPPPSRKARRRAEAEDRRRSVRLRRDLADAIPEGYEELFR